MLSIPFVVCLIAMAVAFIAIQIRASSRELAEFNQKWPAISDDEFAKQCSELIDPNIVKKVRELLSNALGVDYERIHPQQNLMHDLGAE